jgi:signal transduction histidine kinase
MDELLRGPWDEEYYEKRARIGRVHVRLALAQAYLFGAMNVVRQELSWLIEDRLREHGERARTRLALDKLLDLELAIMLHTYREDLIAQKVRSERLSTFGQLVGSISHELRNPLSVVESSLYILQGRLEGDERAHKHIDRICTQLGLAKEIISALLDMIREQPLARERINLGAIVSSVLESAKLPADLRITVAGFDALSEIEGDSLQIRQVLANFIENAAQALGGSGEIWVRSRTTADAVLLTVEDNGPGVDARVRGRLFEPLVTTKTKGIGLGLALVRRIVDRHGGSVSYEPREGGGSRFMVRFPLAAGQAR